MGTLAEVQRQDVGRRSTRDRQNPVFLWLIFAIFMYLPTSLSGHIFGTWWLIAVWFCNLLAIIYVARTQRFDRTSVVIASLLMAYMVAVTIFSLGTPHARFSLARMVPVVGLVGLSTLRFTKAPGIGTIVRIVDTFAVLLIVWNLGIILGVDSVKEFTAAFYNQYQPRALFYSMAYEKPVMSFGIHSYASYFYALMFMLCADLWRRLGKPRFLVYCGALLIFTVFLSSQSALVMVFIMMAVIVRLWAHPLRVLLRETRRRWLISAAVVVVATGALAVAAFWRTLQTSWTIAFKSPTNGFQGRYGQLQELYGENLRVIRSSAGIGFNIIDFSHLSYSDSGYIVYLTMGSVPFAAGVIFLVSRFLWQNFPRPWSWVLLATVLLFEGASTAILNYRFTLVMLFLGIAWVAIQRPDGKDDMPSSRIVKVIATAAYYAAARHLPNQLGGVRMRAALCRHIFKEMGTNVHIAENVYFGRGSNVVALDNASLGKNMKIYGAATVVLGVHCIVGPDVTLVTGDHRVKIDAAGQRHVLNLDRPITVGDYTFVCANTVVVGGVTLERNSLVAAGSVVTRDVESGWMYGGVPARKIRPLERFEPETDGDYAAG